MRRESPSAPAVTAVSVRRVKLDAPVAASVRRSPAVSLRTSPTDIPSTPRAMTIPKIVAQPMTADELGWSFFDSTESCVVDAASSAPLIWAAVKGCDPWTSQAPGLVWMWNLRRACSVMTVFGADVPVGSAPTSWITGCATQPAAAVQVPPLPPDA